MVAGGRSLAIRQLITDHWPLTIILAAFMVFALFYNSTVPVLEAPDEQWHVAYVKYIADGHGLPVESLDRLDLQESHQPPLYYVLGALATFWIDTSDYSALLVSNPHWGYGGRSPDVDNRNLFMHQHPGERFPYRGAALAIHIVRVVSSLAGAITVASAYVLALVLYPGRRGLAVGTAALVAFNPQFLYLSASVNNDALVAALCAVALVLIAQVAGGQVERGRLLALGIVIALALLTKWSAIPLVAAALLALILVGGRWTEDRGARPPSSVLRGVTGRALLVLAPAVLLAGWWFVRNVMLYGDPLDLSVMLQLFPARDPAPSLRQILSELPGQERSFWASFGWENIYPPAWVYIVYLGLDRLAVLGLLMHWISQRMSGGSADRTGQHRLSRYLSASRLRQWLPLLLFTLFVFVAFIQWMRTTYAVGRHLFPALPVIALILMVGLSALARFVGERLAAGGRLLGGDWLCAGAQLIAPLLTGSLGLIAAITPLLWIAPAYQPPPPLTQVQVAAIPHRVVADFGGVLRLLGYDMAFATAPSPCRPVGPVFRPLAAIAYPLEPGGRLCLTLYWQALAPMERNWTVFIHLLGENDTVIAQRDTYPGLGRLPTAAMTPGQTFADTYALDVPITAYAPDVARVQIGFYDGGKWTVGPDQWPALSEPGRGGCLPVAGECALTLASVKVRARPGSVPNPMRLDFGGEIILSGYDVTRRTAQPGDSLGVTLYWQTARPPAHNYTVFVHLVGADGALRAQADARPQPGWTAGPVIADTHVLALPPDLAAGAYELQVGLYRASTGERLRLLSADGAPGDDVVKLTKIRIATDRP